MSHRLRRIAEPFVVAPPAGARVRTRLRVSDADATAIAEVGAHLGSLAGADLARRCAERRLDADGRKASRRARKRALTAASSSRWAGAITRTTNDAWGLAERNLLAERVSAVRYDITYDPGRGRWYLDASWKTGSGGTPSLPVLRCHPVLAVDVNAGHLACWVISPDGNPAGLPITISLDVPGLTASTRDGRLRAAISQLPGITTEHGCQAIVIENLDFGQVRAEGRERAGRRPSHGRRGRAFRRLIAGIPTGQFRDRLSQMASNRGIAIVAVDPAYTSRWGAEHWLAPLSHQFSPTTTVTGHHAAAVVIGRRGLGQRARRTARCDRTRPEDRERRAASPATVQPAPPAPAGGLSEQRTRKPGDRNARRQPPASGVTPDRPNRHPPATRAAKTVRAARQLPSAHADRR